MLDAYDATSDRNYLDKAVHLAGIIEDGYLDTDGAGFYDLRGERDTLGNLQFRTKNIEENAEAAELFRRLDLATGNDRYATLRQSAMRAFAVDSRNYGYFAAGYARTYIRGTRPALEAHIVGQRGAAGTRSLLWGSLRLTEPSKALTVIDPAEDADLLDDLGYPSSPAPAAYLCHNGSCSAPIQQPADLAAAVQGFTTPFRELRLTC